MRSLADRLEARITEMGNEPDYSRLAQDILGIRGATGSLAQRLVAQALVMGDRHESWRRAGQRICRDAPDAPGVYVFRDAEQRALYVGKAAHLRRRLRSHFAERRWLSLKPAMARVTHAEWTEVGSELEALLLEAALIDELQPTVNVQVGAPTLRRRALPQALVVDTVVVLPSVDRDSVEVVAARPDGRCLRCRVPRASDQIGDRAETLWRFFTEPSPADGTASDERLAPLVFAWLRGRGAHATRLAPHEAGTAGVFRHRLALIVNDPQLFSERLVQWSTAEPP